MMDYALRKKMQRTIRNVEKTQQLKNEELKEKLQKRAETNLERQKAFKKKHLKEKREIMKR